MSAPRRRLRWVVATAALCTLLVAPGAAPVRAEDPQDQLEKAQQYQKSLQQESERLKGALGQVAEQANDAQRSWVRAQGEHDSAWNEYLRLKAQQGAAEAELQATEVELARVQAGLVAQQKRLATRMRALYVDGRVDYLSVLFGSSSVGDFLSRWEMLQAVVRQDSTLLVGIKQARANVETKKILVTQKRDNLTDLTRQAAAKNNTAAARKVDVERYRKELDAKRKEYLVALEALERESRRLEDEIQKLEREVARKVGQLSMRFPVTPVEITDTYGMRWHPILGDRRMHNGTDFAANMGQNVYAAEDGVVLVAGWQGAYGNAVIISHGTLNGQTVSTLYAHNSELLAWAGKQVKRGDVIARAGSTGWSTGPHVHFEVRVNGKAVEPMDWLPKR